MDNLLDMLTFKLTTSRIGMLIGGGGVMLAVTSLLGLSLHAKLILAGGMLLVAAVFVLFLLVMKMRAKRKFAAGDDAIQDEMRKRPRKMNNPEALAKVADLSKRFERGVSLYKQATGQRLSECPWYLFTGTPGSGKTEAIRHCGIGMPEGLHEEQQGAGGTVNMDWWFTDDAIILDTAGRYLTDVDSTSEWEEFLKLLNRARPDAPINGMLVALPADSLLKDSSDEVQRKGTEIAKFLDRVRRTLGVRFPVFIVVTKSDLIPGFREFFSHVSDSELQAQIVGWSKPGDLDDAFEPDDVEEYLQTLRATLIRRRMGLLVDPIHTEDVSGRRLDQVDSLYMFPDGLLGIGPRLQRYLQMVFVKSKFNQNPLFLRGIYFTQAFEEGAALDEALARIRNVSLEQLEAEGRGWRRDRALFLRDLFEKKVFKENGLVTRASNTGQLKRKRAMTLIGAGFAAVALLGVFIYYSYQKLGLAISKESDFWAAVHNTQVKKIESLDLMAAGTTGDVASINFVGSKPVMISGHTVVPAGFFGGQNVDGVAAIKDNVEIPRLFKPLLPMKDFNTDRRAAFQALFNQHVLVPLIRDVCDKLKTSDVPTVSSTDTSWTKGGVGVKALIELLKLESVYNGTALPESVKFAPLFQYLQPNPMPDDDTIANLQGTFESIYGLDGSRQSPDYNLTLTQSLDPIHADMDLGATTGTAICINYWKDRCINSHDIFLATNAINTFQVWRDAIELPNNFTDETGQLSQPKSVADYENKHRQWSQWAAPAADAYTKLNTFLKTYPPDNWKKGGRLSLKENYQLQAKRQFEGAKEVFDECNVEIFPATGTLAEPLKKIRANLVNESVARPHDPGEADVLQHAEDCDKWGASIYQDKDKKKRPRLAYEIVSDLCEQASNLLPASLNDPMDPNAVQDRISKADEFNTAEKEAGNAIADSTSADASMKALANVYSYLIAPAVSYVKLKYDVDHFPATAVAFETKISDQVDLAQQKSFALPMAARPDLKIESKYDADAFADQMGKWYDVKDQIDPSTTGGTSRPSAVQFPLVSTLKKECALRQETVDEVVKGYYRYWATLDNEIVPTPESAHIHHWDDVSRQISVDFDSDAINGILVDLYTTQISALQKSFRGSAERKLVPASTFTRLGKLKEACTTAAGGLSKDSNCIMNWRKLAVDNPAATDAQHAILTLTPEDFYKQYLSVESVPYWKELAMISLDTLTNEVRISTKAKLADFATACNRFPVNASEDPVNAIASADEARAILEKLPSNISDSSYAADTIGGNRDTRIDRIDADLRNLRLSSLNPRQKLQKQILTSLSNSSGDVKITFLQREGKKKAATQSPFVGKLEEPELTWQGVTIREWNFEAGHPEKDIATDTDAIKWKHNGSHRFGSAKQDICDELFPQNLSGLTVLFRDTSDRSRIERDNNQVPTNAQQFQGPWPFISMILAQRSPDSPAAVATLTGQTVWTVEVPDPANQTSVLIQLDIPGSNYPSVADWPR